MTISSGEFFYPRRQKWVRILIFHLKFYDFCVGWLFIKRFHKQDRRDY